MSKALLTIIFFLGVSSGLIIHFIFNLESNIIISGLIILIIYLVSISVIAFNLRSKLISANNQIYSKSITDILTNVYNRKFMFELFEKELNRIVRHDREISCILVDIDSFKMYNEKYGRHFGDEILIGIADILKDNLRINDIISRFDSNKFLCVLPETGLEQTLIISKRLKSLMSGEKFQIDNTGAPVHVTTSIGVTSWKPAPEKDTDVNQLVTMAEKALVIAKNDGGNRVDCFLL